MPKERQHFSLKGMSPDLLDNVIMRCGTAYSVCYDAIAQFVGKSPNSFTSKDLLERLNIDKDYKEEKIDSDTKKIRINSTEILNIFRNI